MLIFLCIYKTQNLSGEHTHTHTLARTHTHTHTLARTLTHTHRDWHARADTHTHTPCRPPCSMLRTPSECSANGSQQAVEPSAVLSEDIKYDHVQPEFVQRNLPTTTEMKEATCFTNSTKKRGLALKLSLWTYLPLPHHL